MIEKKLINNPIYYYITDSGKKQSILFIHAAFADHTQFDKQVEFFSEKYNLIAIDLIGHGKSVTLNKSDKIEKVSQYIKDILYFENINKIHLVGISIGSIIVQDFANNFPEMVSSLSSFGGYDVNQFDQSIQKKNRKIQMIMMLKALISIKWFAKSNKAISAYTQIAQEKFYQMNVRFKKKSFIVLAGLNKLVNKHPIKFRNYPILIGCGEKDNEIALHVAKSWHENEPYSQLEIFENSGHLVNMDVPEKFNEVLMDFIEKQ